MNHAIKNKPPVGPITPPPQPPESGPPSGPTANNSSFAPWTPTTGTKLFGPGGLILVVTKELAEIFKSLQKNGTLPPGAMAHFPPWVIPGSILTTAEGKTLKIPKFPPVAPGANSTSRLSFD